jgi:hypothetical protein
MRTTSRGPKNNQGKKSRRKWASGKRAFVICDRTGFKIPYRRSVVEPGTGIRVDRNWSDGIWNRVDHAQNFSADTGEAIAIRDPRPDVTPTMSSFLASDGDGLLILTDDGGQPIFIEE